LQIRFRVSGSGRTDGWFGLGGRSRERRTRSFALPRRHRGARGIVVIVESGFANAGFRVASGGERFLGGFGIGLLVVAFVEIVEERLFCGLLPLEIALTLGFLALGAIAESETLVGFRGVIFREDALQQPGGGPPAALAAGLGGGFDDVQLGGAELAAGEGKLDLEFFVLALPAPEGGRADGGRLGGGTVGEALFADEMADEVDGFVAVGGGTTASQRLVNSTRRGRGKARSGVLRARTSSARGWPRSRRPPRRRQCRRGPLRG